MPTGAEGRTMSTEGEGPQARHAEGDWEISMKKSGASLRSTMLCLFLAAFAAGEVSASPSVSDCRPLGPEEHESLQPAGKRLADLDAGEPRQVRLIYFRPHDRPYRETTAAHLKAMALQAQSFFSEQMEAHGYGPETFPLERDAEGELVVHGVEGQHPDSHYSDDPHVEVFSEIGQVFDLQANIYFAFIDNSRGSIPRGGRVGKSGGTASTSGGDWETVAHELGHAFGLQHDFRNSAYIMAYGVPDRLSACAAELLSAHPFLQPRDSHGLGGATLGGVALGARVSAGCKPLLP